MRGDGGRGVARQGDAGGVRAVKGATIVAEKAKSPRPFGKNESRFPDKLPLLFPEMGLVELFRGGGCRQTGACHPQSPGQHVCGRKRWKKMRKEDEEEFFHGSRVRGREAGGKGAARRPPGKTAMGGQRETKDGKAAGHGRSEGGSEEGEAGVVGGAVDVQEAELEAAEGVGVVDKADLKAADGGRTGNCARAVEESDLDAAEFFGIGAKADLKAAGIAGNGNGGDLDAIENEGHVEESDGDAVAVMRTGDGVQTEAGEGAGVVGEESEVEARDGIVAGSGEVEAESDDGGVFGDKLPVGGAEADLEGGEGDGGRGEGEERKDKGMEEFFHGSRVSGQRLKS